MKHSDVCIAGWGIYLADFIAEVKQQASWCNQLYPEAPFIEVGDAELKNFPRELKHVELAERKVLNMTMGDELAQDIGAVKYVEYSLKTGRGFKILIDEIVFAYFFQVQRRARPKKNKKRSGWSPTRKNETKPFHGQKVSRCSSFILTFVRLLWSINKE